MGMVSGSRVYDDTLNMINAETYLVKSLEGDLNYSRSQLKVITGKTNWYDAPDITLATLGASSYYQGLSGSLANIYSFTGMDDRNDTTPTYSSNNYVADNDSLETAIGKIDGNIDTVLKADTLDDVTTRGNSTTNSITVGAVDAGSGLIQTTGTVEGGALDINGSGDVSGDLYVHGTVTAGTTTRVNVNIVTTGALGVSGSTVFGDDEDNDTTTVVGDLFLWNRLFVNYNGIPGDDFIYFYSNGSVSGSYLQWDDTNSQFVFSNALDVSTHLIHNVVDPVANQDAATKKYVDDTMGAITFTEVDTLDSVTTRGNTTSNTIVINASGSSFQAILDTGDLDVWGNITVDGTVDGIDISSFASAVQTFTGMDDATDGTPTYSSNNVILNDDSLETALGKIDSSISTVTVVKKVERLLVDVTSGSAHAIPGSPGHAAGDGSTMDIFFNGQLMQSNTGTELRDYIESGTDEVKFTFDVPSNSYLTYVIRS